MKLQIIAVTFCSVALGACATQQVQSSLNTEVDGEVEDVETVIGYDVPLHGELIPAAGKSQSKEQDDNVVCKRIQVTGSRFNRRVCMTWGEWKERQQAGKDFMKNHQRRMNQQGNPQRGFDGD